MISSNDIVDRLREPVRKDCDRVRYEAADALEARDAEIERLRKGLEYLSNNPECDVELVALRFLTGDGHELHH